MAAGDLRPDRLTRARYVIRDLLSTVREGRTALVVFGAEPHVVAPLTDDMATIEALLPALSVDIIPAPGDRAGPALRTAGELLQRVGSTHGEVLLLSDGIADPADSIEAVHDLRRQGVPLSVLGVGTPNGAPVPAPGGGFETGPDGNVSLARLDEAGLAALAKAGGGRYQRLDEGGLPAFLETTVGRDPGQARAGERGLERWVEQGPWLLLPLILIAAGGFRRGWVGVLVLFLVLPPQARAFGWQDLWLRPDQQASQLLDTGDAAAAAERFKDSDWRALARYRAGDYAAAAEGFGTNGSDANYNRGNALARAGRLQEAKAAYEAALSQHPEDADARFNHDLVEQLLRRQQKPAGGAEQAGSQQAQGETGADQSAGGASRGADSSAAGQESNNAQASAQQDRASNGKSSEHPDATHSASEQARSGGESANATDGQEQNDTPGGQRDSRNHDSAAGSEKSRVTAPDDEQGQTADDDQRHQANAQPPAPEAGTGEPAPAVHDSAERARADVAPAAAAGSADNPGTPARHVASAADGKTAAPGEEERMSEQDIALEQWLHQVPDDPAGLLRRKFMLEHLLRQKGRQTP